MLLGYARVSTQDQNLNRQLDQLNDAGCMRIYTEKVSGTKVTRIELEKMLDQLREGDIIIVSELTRLSRSTKDLFTLIDRIEKQGANIKSLKESWLDTTTPHGKFMFTIFAGVSQFERDLIADRTREGLASARKRGIKGGRPPKSRDKIELALKMYNDKKYSIAQIEDATNVSKATLYRYINKKQ